MADKLQDITRARSVLQYLDEREREREREGERGICRYDGDLDLSDCLNNEPHMGVKSE